MKCDELMKYGMDDPTIGDDCTMYRVADVDEAIAELKAKLYEADKVIARNKYKRCLAMAEWCDAEADVADADGDYEDMRWYQKWHKRWLKIAEKFKETK